MNTTITALIHLAKKRGITQYQLAKMSGINRASISRIFSGERTPSIDIVERLAAALGCELTFRPAAVHPAKHY